MPAGETKTPKLPSGPYSQRKSLKIFLAILRIFTAMATGIASLSMYLNEEDARISNYQVKVTYKSSPTFRFFIFTNAVVCVYLLLTLPCAMAYWWMVCLVQVLDMLAMGIMAAAGAAVSAISYMGKHAINEVGWLPICEHYENFCFRVSISLISSYTGLGFLYLICVVNFIICSKIAIKATIIHS